MRRIVSARDVAGNSILHLRMRSGREARGDGAAVKPPSQDARRLGSYRVGQHRRDDGNAATEPADQTFQFVHT